CLRRFLLTAGPPGGGPPHADRLSLALVIGHVADLLVYVYLWPVQPGLAAGILGCLLVGGTVLFGWSTRRVFALAVTSCVTFGITVQEALPFGVDRAPATV